jgi:hypothetical protein
LNINEFIETASRRQQDQHQQNEPWVDPKAGNVSLPNLLEINTNVVYSACGTIFGQVYKRSDQIGTRW